ncbi:MAG TPA: tripartite tricarboxylate transporter substrate binding protein [Burkholderiales bacterium]
MIPARKVISAALAAGLVLGVTLASAQETYPARPIRVIVPFSPGASDTQIRAIAPHLSSRLGQPLVVENVPGGGGVIAANQIRAAQPNGYTLFFSGMAALTMVPALRNDVTYRLTDFTPIGNITTVTGVLVVRPNAPYKTMAEFIAYAKSNPGKLNFASPGVGTAGHTMCVGPQALNGFLLTHIPYKGGADVVNAVVAGNVDVGCALPSIVIPQMQAGNMRGLAVTAGARSEFLPDMPTYREVGVDYTDGESYGLLGPKGLPDAIVKKVSAAVAEAVKEPAFRDVMRKTYTSVQYLNPEQYLALLQERERDWQRYLAIPAFRELMKQ